jgi:hypothetical protein
MIKKIILIVIVTLLAIIFWFEVPVTGHITVSGNDKIDTPIRIALITDLQVDEQNCNGDRL